MTLRLPRYTSKDYLVLAFVLLPVTLVINSVIFGSAYYRNGAHFFFATALTAAGFTVHFITCSWVALQMKKRFPSEKQVGTRLAMMITGFILLSGLFLFTFFKGYENFSFLRYRFNETGFIWAWLGMSIVNIFLTFLHEGIARYESWKLNLKETEALKKLYRQGRLQGLKSQVNPHFLFNSLNSLSSLIHEDEKKSEKFLNEMSKVYRYMLQNDEETLVPLRTELRFLESYIYLLKARHGDSLQLNLEIDQAAEEKLVPPLALQAILEDTVACNSICRDCPLVITLKSDAQDLVVIQHNVVPRMASEIEELPEGAGLQNLVSKYRLLNRGELCVQEENRTRSIQLPLITHKEEVLL